MQKINFRTAELADIPQINILVNSAYRGESSKKGWTYEADLLDGQRINNELLEDVINSSDQVIFLGFINQQLIGCAHLKKEQNKAYIGMLTIQPDLQANGFGKQLLSSAEIWIHDHWRAPLVEMTVIQKRTELIAWYERRGYVVTTETRPFPYGDERFGKPKMIDLEFIVLKKVLSTPVYE